MLIVLDGLTGVGKTEMLRDLAAEGEAIIDLEALANHGGSAFGARGLQPSHRRFTKNVAEELRRVASAPRLWIEQEGPFIGAVGVPHELLAGMAVAPRIILTRPRRERVRRIASALAQRRTEDLLRGIDLVEPRAGAERAAASRAALLEGCLDAAVDALLDYYDAAYERRWDATGALLRASAVALPCDASIIVGAFCEMAASL